MKRIILLLGLTTLITIDLFAQVKDTKDGTPSPIKSFTEVRRDDFKKLLGTESNFEGFSIKYDKDKTSLLGSGGFYTYKSKHILLIGGSVGTSTDITNLFNQDVLPTYSLAISYNMLLPWTKYYYDGEFVNNKLGAKARKLQVDLLQMQSELKPDSEEIDIETIRSAQTEQKNFADQITTNDHRFTYRNKIKQSMAKGLEERDRIYTFKRLAWVSFASKYNNDQYGFIDYTRIFKSQQYDTTFQTFSGQISIHGFMGWNHDDYIWNGFSKNAENKFRIRYRPVYIYGSIFGRVSKGNNIADIKKTTVYDLERSDFDTATNVLRQSGKSKSFYKGNYYEFTTTSIGARFLVSPFNHITLDFSAETNLISGSDRAKLSLKNYSVLSAGFFVYTGSKDAFKLNIGVALKRQQTSSNNDWQNRLELITSIPIGPIM